MILAGRMSLYKTSGTDSNGRIGGGPAFKNASPHSPSGSASEWTQVMTVSVSLHILPRPLLGADCGRVVQSRVEIKADTSSISRQSRPEVDGP